MNARIEEILCLLKYAIGLEPGSLGRTAITSIIERQMALEGFSEAGHYGATLASSQAHLQRLIEAVVVTESWFFREPQALEALVALARGLSRARSRPLRLLCYPCATGEEPYSMAIALWEAGLCNFEIDAVDISSTALAKAQLGIYTAYSFRGREPASLQPFLQPCGNGYEVASWIRAKVCFHSGNIMEGPPQRDTPYDAIFCRNLLIYLTPEARSSVLASLRGALAPDGELFLALCETAGTAPSLPAPAPLARVSPKPIKMPPPHEGWTTPPVRSPLKTVRPAPSPPKVSPPSGDLLGLAKVRADAGQLEEAEQLCNTILRNGPSSQAYLILGAIRAAQGGHEVAREHFRRSLYLDPKNVEAMLQMAVYAERDGRLDIAQGLRQRAAKASDVLS